MVPFEPLLRNPHLQTIAGHFWKRPDAAGDFRSNGGCTGPSRTCRSWWNRSVPGRGARRDCHGARPGGLGRSRIHAEPERGGAAGRVRRASLPHAHLRRHRASLPDAVSRRPDQRSAGGAARVSRGEGHAPVFLVGLFAGRERGAQTGRGDGRSGARNCCAASARSRRRSTWRPARAASGSATIASTSARFVRAMRERLCATGRYQARDFAGLRSVIEHRRPHHRALVRFRRRRQLLPDAIRPRLPGRDCACRCC